MQKVSVIVPIYNIEKLLSFCIESIINQTYKEIEIILVDDGSVDNSHKICDDYAKKDNRIKVIHKQNGGLSSARNAGLAIATGEYITFVDGDDALHTDAIEYMVQMQEKYKTDIVQVGFERNYDEFIKAKKYIKEIEIVNSFDNIRFYALDRKIRPEAWAKLFKTKIFDKFRFDETVLYAEDLELGLRLYKNINTTLICQDKLYFYRINSNSLTANSLSKGRLNEANIILDAAEHEKDDKELFQCIFFRGIRCTFAIMNRIVSENRAELYNDIRNIVVSYKNEIMHNKYLGVKYKFGTLILLLCKNYSAYSNITAFRKRITDIIKKVK